MLRKKGKVVKHKQLLSIAICALLAGCSSGPVTPVDHVCRSCEPYQIKGVWYYPQRHYDYEEEGIASWYGPGFHGRPKAMGGHERFDMHDISAAHKTLPLPSVVRVTNLKNGKSMKVLVDDRGPYVDDRIIDLSKGAAKALGVHDHGICNVKVETCVEESQALSKYLGRFGRTGIDRNGRTWNAIYQEEIAPNFNDDGLHITGHTEKENAVASVLKPAKQTLQSQPDESLDLILDKALKESPTTPKITPQDPPLTPVAKTQPVSSAKSYYVEVAHYLQEKNAQQELKNLKSFGHVNVQPFMAGRNQRLYAVKVGPFTNLEKAQSIQQRLSAQGYELARVSTS